MEPTAATMPVRNDAVDIGVSGIARELAEWGMPVRAARVGVVLMWECGGGGRMAPASIEVVEVVVEEGTEAVVEEASTEVEEADTAVEGTEAVNDPNSPHPSAVAPALLAIVGAVLESADPIEAA